MARTQGQRSVNARTMNHRTGARRAGLQLADILSRNWLVLLLRGLAAAAFGVLALVLPKPWISVLIMPFGAYVLADGALGVGMTLGEYAERRYLWALVLWGLSGVGVGLLTLLQPPRSGPQFMSYIALWTVTTGILEIVTAYLLRGKLGAEWLLVLLGITSIAAGVVLMALPAAGHFFRSRFMAACSFALAVQFVVLSIRARWAPMPVA